MKMYMTYPILLTATLLTSGLAKTSFDSSVSISTNVSLTGDDSTGLHQTLSEVQIISLGIATETTEVPPPPTLPLPTQTVIVGGNSLAFHPNTVDAAIGTVVLFRFLAVNHTLTESSLDNPCKSVGRFSSSFANYNPHNRTDSLLTYTVSDSSSHWFYCEQTQPRSHCHSGMVFGLNPGRQMPTFLSNAECSSLPSITSQVSQAPGPSMIVRSLTYQPTAMATNNLSNSTGPGISPQFPGVAQVSRSWPALYILFLTATCSYVVSCVF